MIETSDQQDFVIDITDCLIDLKELSEEGLIDTVYYNDDIIKKIFSVIAKFDSNNAIIVGEHGIGKTATVKQIANYMTQKNAIIPQEFIDYNFSMIDFNKIIMGASLRGIAEEKINGIITSAEEIGDVILFIDDIDILLGPNVKITEFPIDTILKPLFESHKVKLICTSSIDGFNDYIKPSQYLMNQLQPIEMQPKRGEDAIKLVSTLKNKYENYHNLSISEDVIAETVNIIEKNTQNKYFPHAALDIFDGIGADISMLKKENKEIIKITEKIEKIDKKIDLLSEKKDKETHDKIDILEEKKRKLLVSKRKLIKDDILSEKNNDITIDMVKTKISELYGIDMNNIIQKDKNKLQNIEIGMRKYIIGQDEAIHTICNMVKSKKVGLSNPSKPLCVLCVSQTGSGKTLMAKKLAEQLYGSEKDLIRFDMTEFTDKTSVTKIIGSSAGYIGSDKGGIVTEELKKHTRGVLLLDEIEKSCTEVQDTFLEMFDEGRIMDNSGTHIDVRNYIIIMTSNAGAAQLSAFGKGIGFDREKRDNTTDILKKEIKNTFRPEFINRIDKIIYFNRLTEENLRNIIKLEIGYYVPRVQSIGYNLDDSILNGKLVDKIMDDIKDEREYGARPILRALKEELEYNLTNLILNNEYENGHSFTYDELITA